MASMGSVVTKVHNVSACIPSSLQHGALLIVILSLPLQLDNKNFLYMHRVVIPDEELLCSLIYDSHHIPAVTEEQ
jgi:hypothetical protein